MSVKSYDAAAVSITFAGIPIEGFADGTFIVIARDNPSFSLAIGSDGEGMRGKSNDKSGTITLTLIQSSASNDQLAALSVLDEASGDGVGPFLMKDLSGRSLAAAETAWIEKPADIGRAREATNSEWTIRTDALDTISGGH